MNSTAYPDYEHTQNGPWYLLLFALAAVCLSIGWLAPPDPMAAVMLPVVALVVSLLGASFRYLTVVDEGDQLAIRFGPLPLFQKRVPYQDLQTVSQGRMTFLEGWGIQLSLRGGWVWSIWGLDCVVVKYGRKKLRIGTDDAENLTRFLQNRIPNPS